jgi:uncharacterized Zn ribbon protein
MQRTCLNCGKRFEGRNDATLCADCAAASKASRVVRKRICRTCGKEFDGGPRAWYCPECRAERQKAQSREYKQRKRMGNVRNIGSEDICTICGKKYVVQGGLQKYCPECAAEAVKEIDRAQSRQWNRKNIDMDIKHAARELAAAERTCVVCGKSFVPHSSAITCSKECSKELARRNAAQYEKEHSKERNQRRNELLKQKEQAMSPEEYAEYRRKVNAKARENYQKRKEKNQK